MGLNHEKNGGKKSRDTVPLSTKREPVLLFLFWIFKKILVCETAFSYNKFSLVIKLQYVK